MILIVLGTLSRNLITKNISSKKNGNGVQSQKSLIIAL
jgi:hypothetical protein